MMWLDERLEQYAESGVYPFHMPGHKRQGCPTDITEIGGFDNLHAAEGILKEAQQRAADLYGADRAWYLVNGSTCGILAALSAAVPFGGELLLARNCHKAVYHAIELRHYRSHCVYPAGLPEGICGEITVESVRKAVAEYPQAKAMILTSPTYDGLISDIKGISEVLHRAGMILIVDQAHGAHFGLAERLGLMPDPAPAGDERLPDLPHSGSLGADLVITSWHKTLPSMTQTALLLCHGSRVDREKIDHFLDIYETSSPSYVLMASMDRCTRILWEEGKDLILRHHRLLREFYQKTGDLKYLKIFYRPRAFDPSKILILTEKAGMTGWELMDRLRTEDGIELEMGTPGYALALSSMMDSREGFARLAQALHRLDAPAQTGTEKTAGIRPGGTGTTAASVRLYSHRPVPAMEIWQAMESPKEDLPPEQAAGRIAGAYYDIYPPGIPILAPGERITEEIIGKLRACTDYRSLRVTAFRQPESRNHSRRSGPQP